MGAGVRVHVQNGSSHQVPAWAHDVDVVAVRGLRESTLDALAALEHDDVRFCDPPTAVLAVRDRAGVHARLSAVGVRVPGHRIISSWKAVRERAGHAPVVVKHLVGDVGRGARVVRSDREDLPVEPPFTGPYLAEEYIEARTELKLYRIGDRVATLRLPDGDGDATVIHTPGDLRRLAHRVAAALDLSLCGIDVRPGPDGPTVIDVNPFPSARRIPDSAASVADHLLTLARSST